MKAVLKKGKTGKYHFVIVATNGKVICSSETYSSRASCVKTFDKFVLEFKQIDIVLDGPDVPITPVPQPPASNQ